MRQREDHGWHDRQKDTVTSDEARTLHDISTEEKLLSGGLDGGEDQCDRYEEHQRCQVGVKGKGVGVEEVLSQPTD